MKKQLILNKKISLKKSWHLWGNRYLTVRLAEVFSRSAAQYWKNFYGMNFNDHLYVFNGSQTGCYFPSSKLKDLKNFFSKRIKKYTDISKFYTTTADREFHRYLSTAHSSSAGNLQSLTNNQILKRYNSFITSELRVTARFWFIFGI